MALTLTLVVPAVAAVWLLAAGRAYAPRTARGLALLASVVTFLLTLLTVLLRTDVDAPWVSSLGLRWHFAVDGVSVPLALLTAGLGVAVVVHARGREPGRAGGVRGAGRSATNTAGTYYACLLLVEFGALATFFARDAILFFVAFEVVLVPMWVLISRFGDEHATERARADASNRFVLFTAL
ncbi:MAG TPA: NADH-quinone oxidoreductase subunit M, partial [Lapillicoccus sp.]|nr:NADH-quinone oxidoreductase subunit M [Lapillicoccus sp.]